MHGKSSNWERIEAGEVKVGDQINHTRNYPPYRITAVSPGPSSVWLTDHHGSRERPRKSKRVWRWVG